MCTRSDFPPYDVVPGAMPDDLFRQLDASTEADFRRWARENHSPGEYVNPLWHPVVRDECGRMDAGLAPERTGRAT